MPPWVEYDLTERGTELAQALQPLARWGRSHLSEGLPEDFGSGPRDDHPGPTDRAGGAEARDGAATVAAETR